MTLEELLARPDVRYAHSGQAGYAAAKRMFYEATVETKSRKWFFSGAQLTEAEAVANVVRQLDERNGTR